MKKTILTVMLVMMALTALAAVSAPTVHNSDGSTSNYWVHYYHSRYTYRPVYFYRPVYVAPVVYPVYTYHYWYYKFAGR